MRVTVTVVYDVPDDMHPGWQNVLATKLAQQCAPREICLAAGEPGYLRMAEPRVHTVQVHPLTDAETVQWGLQRLRQAQASE